MAALEAEAPADPVLSLCFGVELLVAQGEQPHFGLFRLFAGEKDT